MKNMIKRINEIYDFYGPEVETKKFYEEIEELRQAVENEDRKNIKEEIADVFITTIHMMSKYNISKEEVIKLIEYKIIRQKNRMFQEQLKSKLTDKNKIKIIKFMEEFQN